MLQLKSGFVKILPRETGDWCLKDLHPAWLGISPRENCSALACNNCVTSAIAAFLAAGKGCPSAAWLGCVLAMRSDQKDMSCLALFFLASVLLLEKDLEKYFIHISEYPNDCKLHTNDCKLNLSALDVGTLAIFHIYLTWHQCIYDKFMDFCLRWT